jgi:hypothetical protein
LAYDNHLKIYHSAEKFEKLRNFSPNGTVFENPLGLTEDEIRRTIRDNYPADIVKRETSILLTSMPEVPMRKNQRRRQKRLRLNPAAAQPSSPKDGASGDAKHM